MLNASEKTLKQIKGLSNCITNELDSHNLCILYKAKKGKTKDMIYILPEGRCELKFNVNYNKILKGISKEITDMNKIKKSRNFDLPIIAE